MGIKGSSQELQEVTIIALLHDPYLLANCIPEMNESYFVKPGYKLIYSALRKFYEKYMKIPSEKEMELSVQESFREDYGRIVDIMDDLHKLYSSEIKNEDFLYEKVTDFIRRNKVERVLQRVVSYIEEGDIDLNKVADELSDGMTINFSRAPAYRLSDITKIRDIRREALGDTENPVIVKMFIDSLNWSMQYKGLIPGTINMVVAPPGRGKTTFLINQGLSTAQQGFTCLHIFLGDMTKYDGLLRYLSCLSGVPTSKLVDMSDDDLTKFVRKYNMTGVLSNLMIASYAADELTASKLVEEVKNIQKKNSVHFNVIIVDYDENLAKDSDSMYESGGNVYNKIALFAALNKSVIFIAAQPKPAYWKEEIIPLEAAAESSKKQKIIDLMLTIGKQRKELSVGTLNIAKNRRGDDCKHFRLSFNGANAQVRHISEADYQSIMSKEKMEIAQRASDMKNKKE